MHTHGIVDSATMQNKTNDVQDQTEDSDHLDTNRDDEVPIDKQQFKAIFRYNITVKEQNEQEPQEDSKRQNDRRLTPEPTTTAVVKGKQKKTSEVKKRKRKSGKLRKKTSISFDVSSGKGGFDNVCNNNNRTKVKKKKLKRQENNSKRKTTACNQRHLSWKHIKKKIYLNLRRRHAKQTGISYGQSGKFIRPRLNCTFVLLYCVVCCNSMLQVSMNDKTITMGDTMTLTCTSDGNTMMALSWLNGSRSIIAIGEKSANDQKYLPIIFNTTVFTYQLIVKDFNIDDFGTYICEMGFDQQSKMVSVNDKRFIYKPQKNEYAINITQSSEFLNVSIQIAEIFPVPECHVIFEKTTTMHQGLLHKRKYGYSAFLHGLVHLNEKCKGVVSVICDTLSERVVDVKREFDSCRDLKSSDLLSIVIPTVLVSVIVLLIVPVAFIIRKRKRDKSGCVKKHSPDSGNEERLIS